MFAIMTSAVAYLMRWLVTSGGMKILFSGLLLWLFTLAVEFLIGLIPSADLSELFSGMPALGLHMMHWLQLPAGLVIFGGFLTARFLLRRIPFIGG